MSYVKTINEDGTVSDIMAVALDPTLDATLVHTADVTTDTDITTAGKVADARAIKTLTDDVDALETAVGTTIPATYATQTALTAAINGVVIHSASVAANGNKTFNVGNLARFFMLMSSSNTASHSILIGSSSSNATVAITDVLHGSNITIDTATNGKMKITNGGSAALVICFIEIGSQKITE